MSRRTPAWVPALREGVGASRVAVHGGPWVDVLEFLVQRFPDTASEWPGRLLRGEVLNDIGQPVGVGAPAMVGRHLWYWRNPPPEHRVPFEIELLYQDEHLVVVDKPHFMAVAPVGRHLHETALVRLRQRLGIDSLAPMHRLDADTAGVLVFIVQAAERDAYHALLRDRQVHKVYEAIAPWRADLVLPMVCRSRLEQTGGADFMQMQSVAGEANAQTLIDLISRLGTRLAHYRLTPHTGRRHQLRAQMSALGLPIVGDRIYPRLWPEPAPGAAPDYSQPLQLLAREIAFTDPISGQARRFTSRRQLLACAQPR